MTSMGIHWDEPTDTATITMDGVVGSGQLSGVTATAAMNLALMLARFARSHGAAWPIVGHQDVWDWYSRDGLQAALDPAAVARWEAPTLEPKIEPKIDVETLGADLDQVRQLLRQAMSYVGSAEATLGRD